MDGLTSSMWQLIFLMIVSAACDAKPNIIIMLMDDVGWGDLGCFGNPAMETPNLDRMAAEGMLFTDMYSASPICSPSRASLLSGRHPVRNGFYTTNQKAKNSYTPQQVLGGIPNTEILFPELLQKAGYRTKLVGKWHLGHREQYLPLQHGFHEWFGAPNCHYKYNDKTIPNIPVYKDAEMIGRYYDDIMIDEKTGESNLTQMYIQEAVEFIEKQANKDESFFLLWTPDATHTPLYASQKFRGHSQRGLYGDAVMELDYGVGQILDVVKELKIDEETFVFFSSDNGAATYAYTAGGSNGPFLCGKQTTFEGGQREPAIAWWPNNIRPKQVSRQVSNLMDLYQTVMQLANISPPAQLQFDGESLVSTLLNGTHKERSMFYYRGDTLFKVRHGEYKAHLYTWATPADAQLMGYHYCPGQYVTNVTTDAMTDYRKQPLLFHLGMDPGEKYPISPQSSEYAAAMKKINDVLAEHKRNMKFGEPQLNWCDEAVQNWTPRGCEKLNRCLPVPPSKPFKCSWPY